MSLSAPHPRGTSLPAELARRGFTDPAGAADRLRRLEDDASWLLDALADTPDPDLALDALTRLLAVAFNAADLRDVLRERDGFRARLLAVLGTSRALGDHLERHPGDWQALADDAVTLVRPTRLGLERTLLAAVGADPDRLPWGAGPDAPCARGAGVDVLDDLRSAYRCCLLGLAARDLSGTVEVADVAAELADLAGAALTAALAVAAAGLPEDAAPCRLAVIGMGKCGGRELNYVSDVDVIFVAEPLHPGEPDEPALRTATRLATGLMRACAEATPGGALWPVDAALRPEGKDGPLVRTLASHRAYYQRWARPWEFQALLKARPVAGDLALGTAYVDALAPLVWSVSERPGFVEDVQAMRRRVERSLPAGSADRELKLGPGWLRDVEFSVQLLQLVHGRTDPTLRAGSTLVALDALAAGGYVGRDDARRLGDSYRFLRTVEHRLQLDRLRRTHRLPSKPEEVRRLARVLGYRGDAAAQFEADRSRCAREVRRLHEKLFYRPLLQAVARLPADSAHLDERLDRAAARERLAALGFADPEGALRHLAALTDGMSRRAAIQRTLLPTMLGAFADAPDPDAGLLAYRQVSDALGSTPWYLRLLRDEGVPGHPAAVQLARLLAGSRFVADLLGRAPEGVAILARDELEPRGREQLVAALQAAVRRREDAESAVVGVRGVRRQELLRIAAADLSGRLDVAAVGRALSDLAVATLWAALSAATRKVEVERRGPLPVRLTIVAMGRLGGGEQGYGSDADVQFVHDSVAGASDSDAASAARDVAEELRRLLALPAPDPPLRVDAGLRPEGRQGPLTRSLAGYAEYYRRRSRPWEAQALLRAEPIAGDEDLGRRFVALVDPVRYPAGGLSPEQLVELRRIKARVETERLPRGADPGTHLKLGPGGLADVEWTAQLLQLRHGAQLPALRTLGTLTALDAARDAGLLAADDTRDLAAAWQLATRARNATVLVTGRSADALPADRRDLAGVAALLGYAAATDRLPGTVEAPLAAADLLREDYRRRARRARAVVERVFYR